MKQAAEKKSAACFIFKSNGCYLWSSMNSSRPDSNYIKKHSFLIYAVNITGYIYYHRKITFL